MLRGQMLYYENVLERAVLPVETRSFVTNESITRPRDQSMFTIFFANYDKYFSNSLRKYARRHMACGCISRLLSRFTFARWLEPKQRRLSAFETSRLSDKYSKCDFSLRTFATNVSAYAV